jgi:hypothetical protein
MVPTIILAPNFCYKKYIGRLYEKRNERGSATNHDDSGYVCPYLDGDIQSVPILGVRL